MRHGVGDGRHVRAHVGEDVGLLLLQELVVVDEHDDGARYFGRVLGLNDVVSTAYVILGTQIQVE